jgi:glycosyltransferase involved in cell wall biosynthesis
MIYYWPGADHDVPSGGVRTHYDHVRILNAAGIPASILHVTPGFRCTWFPHDVPIAYAPTAMLGGDDILVMSEILGPSTAQMVAGVRKVIFAQNVHYTWRGWPVPPTTPAPYTQPDVVATLVLTQYEREMLRWVWPDHPVYVTPHGIDPKHFPYGTAKTKQIAYMPRKHADEAQQVFGYLHARGSLDGWDVVPIHGKSQAETAAILAASLIFVPFGYPEGGTLPPFEAMAAGCVTIGYGGFASDTLMADCGGIVTPSGDSCRLAQTLDGWLRTDPLFLTRRGRIMSQTTLDVLSVDKERDAVLAAWQAIR